MRMHFHKGNRKKGPVYKYLFPAGVILGVVLWNLEKQDLLSRDLLTEISCIQPREAYLFWYLLRCRFTLFLIIVIAAVMPVGIYVLDAMTLWMGMTMGILVGTTVGVYGIKGILLILAGLFPQGILLIPCYVYGVILADRTCRKLYVSGSGELRGSNRRLWGRYALRMAAVGTLIGVGCLAECRYNLPFLKTVLRIF